MQKEKTHVVKKINLIMVNTLPKYKNMNGNINNNNHVQNISIISNDSGVFIPPPHNNMNN